MKKVKCDSCDGEIESAHAFLHDGRTYCPECAAEHLRREHSREAVELDRDLTKHSPEAKRAYTYKSY